MVGKHMAVVSDLQFEIFGHQPVVMVVKSWSRHEILPARVLCGDKSYSANHRPLGFLAIHLQPL